MPLKHLGLLVGLVPRLRLDLLEDLETLLTPDPLAVLGIRLLLELQ
ncbi:hypothetical protein KV679_16180 [Bacillus sp. JRC01]|nr:hypothetical protein [Bacillus sp. JRC01]